MVGSQAQADVNEDVTANKTESNMASNDAGTASGATSLTRFVFQEKSNHPLVEKIATALVLVSTGCWLVIFGTCKVAALAAPWCVVLSIVSAISLFRVLRRPQQESLSLLNFGGLEPTSLRQTTALSYAIFSLAMCTWMVLHKDIEFKKPIEANRQIIDIELVSDKDFENNNDILPSTEKKDSVKERSAENEVTQQSPRPLAAQKTPSAPHLKFLVHAPVENESKMFSSKPPKVASTPDIFPIKITEAPRATPVAVKPQSQPARSDDDQPMLEEVAPVEMMEMTENSGDKGNESYQAGGRSSGGTGTPAPISAYLKELHRRIKHAWTPPTGDNRSAELLFRIKRNGTLASIKIVRSSGDEDIDQSAMKAIAACSPFKNLPNDYAPAYLDLQYTFNYRVDALSEVNSRRM